MLLVTIPGTSERIEVGAGASLARTVSGGCPAGGINDAYRSYAEQVAIFKARYTVRWSGSGTYGDVRRLARDVIQLARLVGNVLDSTDSGTP